MKAIPIVFSVLAAFNDLVTAEPLRVSWARDRGLSPLPQLFRHGTAPDSPEELTSWMIFANAQIDLISGDAYLLQEWHETKAAIAYQQEDFNTMHDALSDAFTLKAPEGSELQESLYMHLQTRRIFVEAMSREQQKARDNAEHWPVALDKSTEHLLDAYAVAIAEPELLSEFCSTFNQASGQPYTRVLDDRAKWSDKNPNAMFDEGSLYKTVRINWQQDSPMLHYKNKRPEVYDALKEVEAICDAATGSQRLEM
jgi:hypothetical protein